jgi:hypothetical protein
VVPSSLGTRDRRGVSARTVFSGLARRAHGRAQSGPDPRLLRAGRTIGPGQANRLVHPARVRTSGTYRALAVVRCRGLARHVAACATVLPGRALGAVGDGTEGSARAGPTHLIRRRRSGLRHEGPRHARGEESAGSIPIEAAIGASRGAVAIGALAGATAWVGFHAATAEGERQNTNKQQGVF